MQENKKSERVFYSDPIIENPCLNKFLLLDEIALGYKYAADFLIKGIDEGNIPCLDFRGGSLVFPIVFLYRHYLELRLKDIIQEGQDLIGHEPTFPKHHKLSGLWKEAKDIIEKVYRNDDPQELVKIEQVLEIFNKVDPDSYSFRYPADKSGNKYLAEWENVNLNELAEEIEKIYQFLEGVSCGIAAFKDYK